MYKFYRVEHRIAVYTIDGCFRGTFSWAELFNLGYLGV